MQLPPALNTIKNLLQGKGLVAHPIHVAINHVPLGLWEGSIVFDLLARRSNNRALAEGGYRLNLYGIYTAIPTALTGVAEFADVPRDHPAWKVVLAHATLNDIALGLSAYNWWTRRKRPHYMPDTTNLWVSGALGAVLGLSGYLGGVIAHEYGYGTHRQGSSVPKLHESLVGPQDEFDQPKIVQSEPTTGSMNSMAGVAADELNERDQTIEGEIANPHQTREMGGTGI